MRILSGYHFRDMHSVILRKEKEANTTSRTAHAVCIQNSGFVFVFPLRIRFAKDLHSDNHWIYLVIEYQIHLMLIIMLWSIKKMNIALMAREKANKTSKTLSVVCVHNRALLRA